MWLWIYYDYACYLMLEWERDSKKNRKENNQEDQISELTFNFHGALSILTSVFTKKSKKKDKKDK